MTIRQPVTISAAELLARREALGLTQAQLAAALGMQRRQIIRYETGAAPVPTLVAHASAWLLLNPPGRAAAPPSRR